jgi:2-C-methyl-D-erythritol 4-phosphate cytidylyltransferase
MPKDVQEATRSILEAHIQTSYCVVAGGPSRQASVDCGIRASQAEYLLIHDAARPFISFDDGQHLLQQLRAHPDRVAILADRCTATVKTIDSATHCVTGGIPRESLALASTPQGLSRHIWQQFTPGDQATDEAGRAEKIGVPVDVVWAEHPNPKITSVSDWRLAEALKHLL